MKSLTNSKKEAVPLNSSFLNEKHILKLAGTWKYSSLVQQYVRPFTTFLECFWSETILIHQEIMKWKSFTQIKSTCRRSTMAHTAHHEKLCQPFYQQFIRFLFSSELFYSICLFGKWIGKCFRLQRKVSAWKSEQKNIFCLPTMATTWLNW